MTNICKECADPSWSGQAPIKVPRLPVDGKVLEFDTFDDFPTKGESGFIYIDLETNDFYKWDIDEEKYVAIGGGEAGVTVGYLYDGKFYKDEEHTQEITPTLNALYLDITDGANKLYTYQNSAYVEVSKGVDDVLLNGESVVGADNVAEIEIDPNSAEESTAKLNSIKIQGVVYSLVSGGALVFQDYSNMVADLNARGAEDLPLGYNIYIATLDVPDLWVQVNNEATSVPYTYTTDAQFVADLASAGTAGLQIGYYKVNRLETDKVTVPVQDVQVDGASILSGGVANIPLAGTSAYGVIKTNPNYATAMSSGNFITQTKSISQYEASGNGMFIGKGTLENVLADRVENKTTFACEMADGTSKTLTINGTLA